MRLLTSGRLKALERGPRAGGQALALAADPLNRRILRGMASRTVNMDGELYALSDEGREALFVAAVVSCEAGFEQRADAWALGSLDGWLDTVIDPDAKAVRTGGDAWLTGALVSAIHHALFGAREG